MELLNLFVAFFKVGLFTIGGGLVAIPIMQEYVYQYGWVEPDMFIDMIAVSQSTPGPIGVNMATYVGLTQYGLLGSIVVTVGMVLPSFIIISIISHFMKSFKENVHVKAVLKTIRPAAVGGIIAAAYLIATVSVLDLELFKITGSIMDMFKWKNLIVFGVFFGAMLKFKIHPILYIIAGGLVGVILF